MTMAEERQADAQDPPMAACDVDVSKEAATKSGKRLFSVVTTVRAREVELDTVPGLAGYRLVEEEKKGRTGKNPRKASAGNGTAQTTGGTTARP
jgi:hypothetical protein